MSDTITPDICPQCGGRVSVTTAVRIVSLDEGVTVVPVSATLPQCLKCGEVFLTPQQADALLKQAEAAT